jgi:hypothetical protein
MLINWVAARDHDRSLLLRRLARDDAGQDLIGSVMIARRFNSVPDDSIEDGRRVSGLERQRAPSRTPRRPCSRRRSEGNLPDRNGDQLMSVAQVVCLAIAVVACAWDLKPDAFRSS